MCYSNTCTCLPLELLPSSALNKMKRASAGEFGPPISADISAGMNDSCCRNSAKYRTYSLCVNDTELQQGGRKQPDAKRKLPILRVSPGK